MAERATLTVTKPLPPSIALRLEGAHDPWGDDEAEGILSSGVAPAEKRLDAMAAKLGMKPKDGHETAYGFTGFEAWYQRTYRNG